METAELINKLGVRHRLSAAYRTLFGTGFAVVPGLGRVYATRTLTCVTTACACWTTSWRQKRSAI
jgi:hypothetical protein